MFAMIKTEFQKMKRYSILLVGMIGMLCSPLLQLFSQAVMSAEYQNPHFDFAALVNATIWGNATIFMPVLITLIGGYLINREYVDDTLKNMFTVPLSFRRLLSGKLAAIGLLAVILGVYCTVITLIVGICAGLPDRTVLVLARGLVQMIGLSIGVYIVVLPIIILCSQKQGGFMSGSVIAFIMGYCCMFFKEGLLREIYPFSAVLTMIGFDTADWAGTTGKGNVLLGGLSLGVMIFTSLALLYFAKSPESAKQGRGGKKGSIMLRSAQRVHQAFILFFTVSLLLTGCSKEVVLDQYNRVIQSAGDVALTNGLSLKGERSFGDDHYTGSYTADYKDFSKTEYLFGGTSIERENGNNISVSCDLEITNGTAQIFWLFGSDDPVILLETEGSSEETITLPAGGNYIGITGNDFTGHLELTIE